MRLAPIIDLEPAEQVISPGLKGYTCHHTASTGFLKANLKDAYAHNHPSCREILSLLSFHKETTTNSRSAIWICTAPYAFTKLMKPIVQFCHTISILILIYLDNMLICSPLEPRTSLNSPLALDSIRIHSQHTKVCPDFNTTVGLPIG